MIKRLFILAITLFFAWQFYLLAVGTQTPEQPSPTAGHYIERGRDELGAANIVTAIVVTYRGLDTLGEVAVLFLAAAGVGLILKRRKSEGGGEAEHRLSSEILVTGSSVLIPFIIMFGVYIFLGGHLSPGGGFQGGAVIASALLLAMLADPRYRIGHRALTMVESLSGAGYVVVGLLGIVLAGGFLDSRMLPAGEFGRIASAGAIPLIYLLIGLKVGAELAGVIDRMRSER